MPDTHPLSHHVSELLAPILPAHSSILVGLSGGVDSVVLLHLLQQLSQKYAWQLSALHVHHGISPYAGTWADFCSNLCTQYHIPLHIEHVDITPLRAQGIEAAARKLRHAAFAKQPCDFVALAHHADDQSETLLLQLLRGAGVRGASAMPVLSSSKWPVLSLSKQPPLSEYGGQHNIVRPLLHCSRGEILDYARCHQLQWVEDESNADDSYPRNFLRHHVLPLLEEKFPAYRETLVRSTQNFAEASSLLDELAQLDAGSTGFPETLAVSALQTLSQPRARNLLRYFLRGAGAPMPQVVQLENMLHQLCNARQDASVCIDYAGGDWQIRRYQGQVYVLHRLEEFNRNEMLPWHGETVLDWPALNTRLRFNFTQPQQPVKEKIISLAKLQRAPVTIRLRQGGEALRVSRNSPHRTVKNLLQEHHVPPWQRDRLPLLYCGNDLVCVMGIAVDAAYQADGEEAGVQFLEDKSIVE